MSLEFDWYLPTNGDGPRLGNSGLPRPSDYLRDYRAPTADYLERVASTAEYAGFDGLLVPTAAGFEDPWLVCAMLAMATRRIRFTVTFRPGLEDPFHIARRCATLQALCAGRLELFAASGSSANEQRALGDFLSHDERYRRSSECLRLLRHLWNGDHQFAGEHYTLNPTSAGVPLDPQPRLLVGGASQPAEQMASSQADTYLLWAEPPARVAERVSRLRAMAAMFGRTLHFGLRVHVIARETEAHAWDRAQALIDDLSLHTLAEARLQLSAYESAAQRRQSELSRINETSAGRARQLEIYPGLWAGIGLVRGGAGSALVGSYDQVAQLIGQYHAVGIDRFVLSSFPNLEEATRVGEHVLPRVTRLALAS